MTWTEPSHMQSLSCPDGAGNKEDGGGAGEEGAEQMLIHLQLRGGAGKTERANFLSVVIIPTCQVQIYNEEHYINHLLAAS